MVLLRFRPGVSGSVAQPLPPTVGPAGTYKPAYVPWFGINTGNYSAADDPDVQLPPIPIEWIIAPKDVQPGQCPSAAATMGSFGATAVTVALGLLVLGRRTVVHRLTFGFCGTHHGKGVFFTWLISVTLHVVSNLFVSAIIVTSPGYEQLSMGTVFALYASRPSFTMAFMALARILGLKTKLSAEQLHQLQPVSRIEDVGEYVYVDSYITSAVAEVVLRIVAGFFISITWARFPDKIIKAHMRTVITYTQLLPLIVLFCCVCVPIWHRKPSWRQRGSRIMYAILLLPVVVAFVTGPWIYWSFFLNLPGSLWCPPKLVLLTAIWSVTQLLAGSLGA